MPAAEYGRVQRDRAEHPIPIPTPTRRSATARTCCGVEITPTAPKACNVTPGHGPHLPLGSSHGASPWAFHRTSDALPNRSHKEPGMTTSIEHPPAGVPDATAARAADHLWMHFARQGRHPETPIPVDHPRGGRLHLGQPGPEDPGRAVWAVRRPGRARASRAGRGGRQAGRRAGVLPGVGLHHPCAGRAGRADRRPRARRSEPRLLHHRRGRGSGVGVEGREAVLQADRQAPEAQGDQPRGRLSRHPARRPGHHRPARHEEGLRTAGPGRLPGTQHQSLPSPRVRRRPEGLRPLGRRPDRGGDPLRGRRHRRRGVPGAGAELRRLPHATAGLLRTGPRDLRQA